MNTTTFNWTRVLRTLVALMVIFSLVLCGCAGTGEENGGEGNKGNGGNSNNAGVLGGDGDGKLESEDVVGGITGVYGNLLETIGGKNDMLTSGGYSMDLTVTLGDMLLDNLSASLEQAEVDADLSWFESIGIVMDVLYDESLVQMNMGAQLNGTSIATIEAIVNIMSSSVYLRVPELNNQYVGGTVDMDMDVEDMMQQYDQMLAMMEEYGDIVNVLPTEKELGQLINRYIDAAKGAMTKPATGKETLSYDGISQEVTATTYTINRTELLNMAEAIATTAKTDKDLEKFLDNLVAWVDEKAAEQDPNYESVDVHAQLMESIEAFLGQIEEMRSELENNEEDDVAMLVVTIYTVNEQFAGLKLAANDGWDTMEVQYFSLEQNGKTALYLNVGGQFQFAGTGTKSGNEVSGTYTLQVEGTDMLFVTVKDFDTAALKNGNLVGTLQLRFSEEMIDQIRNDMITPDMVIELVLNISGSKNTIGINIYNGSDLLFGIKLTTKMLSGNISVPSKYADVQDSEAMQEWASGISFDAILSNLRNAGVASELVDMLETAIEQNLAPNMGL